MFAWRVQDATRRLIVGTGTLLGRLVRLTILAGLVAGAAQGLLYAAAWWNDGMLEMELQSILAPHQSPRDLERLLDARVETSLDVDAYVRVDVICPAPGDAGVLETAGATCLLRGRVEYERDVLFMRRHTSLAPSRKVFRDTLPAR